MSDNQALLTQDITNEALTWPERARALAITTPESYQSAADYLKAIEALRKKVNEVFGPIVKAAHAAHVEAKRQQNLADGPLFEAKTILSIAMGNYQVAQEAIEREKAEARAAEARKQEEERRINAAVEAEQAGDKATAEAILSEPVLNVPVAVPEPATPKVEGVSIRENWKFEVVNPLLVPREYLMPNETLIGATVRARKGQIEIPGVRIYAERKASARTA